MESSIFNFKSFVLDNKQKTLVLNDDVIELQSHSKSICFERKNILAYRFGVRWIKGIEFTIGREYQIFIKNKNEDILPIKFKTYYGYKNKELTKTYLNILDKIWFTYFDDLADYFLKKFEDHEEFTIGDVHFNKTGLQINISGLFSTQKTTIDWNHVKTHDYRTYFSVYSSQNPDKINRGYSYLEDWNTNLLYSVIRTILKNKGLESY